VASACASSRRGEDDDVLLIFIHAKRYMGRDGLCWADGAGLLGGLHGQVRSFSLFLLFLFSFLVLNSVFNSILNALLFCRYFLFE
jgi:hypothetical protein